MIWSTEHVKSLRLRLGWSRAEFGRRLGLDLERVYKLEEGSLTLDNELLTALDTLSASLEDYCKDLKVKAKASRQFQSREKTQASSAELEEFAFEQENK